MLSPYYFFGTANKIIDNIIDFYMKVPVPIFKSSLSAKSTFYVKKSHNIMAMANPEDIIKGLNSGRWNNRVEAVRGARSYCLEDPESLKEIMPLLISHLHYDAPYKLHQLIIDTLAYLGRPARDVLYELLNSNNWKIRRNSLHALGHLGELDPEVVVNVSGRVAELLKDKNHQVMWAAIIALSRASLKKPDLIGNTIDPLVEILKCEELDVTIFTTYELHHICQKNPHVLRPIITYFALELKKDDRVARLRAMEAIKRIIAAAPETYHIIIPIMVETKLEGRGLEEIKEISGYYRSF